MGKKKDMHVKWANQDLPFVAVCQYASNQKTNGEFGYPTSNYFRVDFWNSSFCVTWPSKLRFYVYGSHVWGF